MSGVRASGGRGSEPTSAVPTAAFPTTAVPTSAVPTSAVPTAAVPTSRVPTSAASGPSVPARPGRGVRILDVVVGVLAAGCVLLGVLLLALQLLAPSALAGWGIQDATGPGWSLVAAHLAVGLAGEVVVGLRRRWPGPVRAGVDAAVVVMALAVLWWGWWN